MNCSTMTQHTTRIRGMLKPLAFVNIVKTFVSRKRNVSHFVDGAKALMDGMETFGARRWNETSWMYNPHSEKCRTNTLR